MTRRQTIEFTRDWIHAGASHVAGDRIDLPEAKAKHLRSLGAGVIVTRAPAVAPASRPSKRKSPTTAPE